MTAPPVAEATHTELRTHSAIGLPTDYTEPVGAAKEYMRTSNMYFTRQHARRFIEKVKEAWDVAQAEVEARRADAELKSKFEDPDRMGSRGAGTRREGRAVTVVIDGEVIESPGSNMEALEQRLMGLSAVSVEQREAEITATLEHSAQLLALVSQATDPARFASAGKNAAAMASEYSKRLGVSKDLVLDAQVQQRRWERALGVAIREGQISGSIRGRGAQSHRINQDASGKDVYDIFSLSRPSDFVSSKTELSNPHGTGIYAITDGVTDSEFGEALDQSREEGNVFRANVVRKIKEAKGTSPAPEPTRKGDPRRAKNQIDTLRRLITSFEGTQIILDDFSRVGLDPAITDEEANEIIAGLDTFVRAIGRVKKSLNGN